MATIKEDLDQILNVYSLDYNATNAVLALAKTFQSHNITIEDWNTIVTYVNTNTNFAKALKTFLPEMIDAIEHRVVVFPSLDTIDAADYSEGTIVLSSSTKILYIVNNNHFNLYLDLNRINEVVTRTEMNEAIQESLNTFQENIISPITEDIESLEDSVSALNDSKLNKSTTEGSFVYGHDGEEQLEISYDSAASADTIAKRTAQGDLLVNETPHENTSATPKIYTDTFAKNIEVSIDSSTYVVTFTLKDANGNTLATRTIDLPLESVVVSGSYDSATKQIILTLQNGNTISIPVASLVDGLVSTDELDEALLLKEDIANKSTSVTEQSTDTEYPSAKAVYTSVKGVSDSLNADIIAETSRAEQAEGSLSDEIFSVKTKYFNGIVGGENVDSQVSYQKSWCYNGSMIVGGDTPSTVVLRFTQISNKALYIKYILINYTRDGEEFTYAYEFTSKQFTANNETKELNGINWLLSDTNNVTYFAYNQNYGQQVGSGSLGIRNCSLTTTDLAGCTITKVIILACGAANTNCKLSVEVAENTWLYHEGLEDESTQCTLQANPSMLDNIEFTYGEGSTPGQGEIVNFHNVFLEKNRNNEIVQTTPEEETLYVNKDNFLFYMWDNGEFFVISKTLTLGNTSTTAYRGDWGSQNHSNIVSLQNVKLNKSNLGEVLTNNIYDDTLTYDVGNIVYYGSYLYRCIVPVTEPEAFDGNKWVATTVESLITKEHIGLGNVDNTSDLDKPVSTATQTALNLKEDKANKVTVLSNISTDTEYPSAKCVYDSLNDRLTYEEALTILNGSSPSVINFVGTYNYSIGGTVYTTLVLNNDNTGTYTYGNEVISFTYEANENSITLTKVSGSVSNYEIFIDSTTATSTEIVVANDTCNTIKLNVRGRVSTNVQSFIRSA